MRQVVFLVFDLIDTVFEDLLDKTDLARNLIVTAHPLLEQLEHLRGQYQLKGTFTSYGSGVEGHNAGRH